MIGYFGSAKREQKEDIKPVAEAKLNTNETTIKEGGIKEVDLR